MFHNNLARPQNMACRREPDRDAIDLDRFTKFQSLSCVSEVLTITRRHDVEGCWCGEDSSVTCARMICVAMCDDSFVDRAAYGVDVEVARGTIEPLRRGVQEVVWPKHALEITPFDRLSTDAIVIVRNS